MSELRARAGVSARALEFAILTTTRTGETLNARWSEIDTASKIWTIPAERMKAGRAHRVPLSIRALQILEGLPREGDFVFIGAHADRPLSNMSLLSTLRRMGRDDLTAHGFRSTFRDWCADWTTYERDVAEMALAHAIKDQSGSCLSAGGRFGEAAGADVALGEVLRLGVTRRERSCAPWLRLGNLGRCNLDGTGGPRTREFFRKSKHTALPFGRAHLGSAQKSSADLPRPLEPTTAQKSSADLPRPLEPTTTRRAISGMWMT